MKKKIRLQTTNRDIYEKLNMLNIVDEVILDNNKVINNMIRKIDGVEGVHLSNDLLLVKKKKPLRLDIYLR